MQHEREDAISNAPPSQDSNSSGSIMMMSHEELLEASMARIGGALPAMLLGASSTTTRERLAGDDYEDVNITNNNNTMMMRKKAMPTTSANTTWPCHLCKAENFDGLAYRCGVCGVRKEPRNSTERGPLRRRGSLSSTSSIDSFTIDDLVSNLEGIEVDIRNHRNIDGGSCSTGSNNTNNNNDLYSNNCSWNDSAASRLSSGRWSLQDKEKWTCSMCTFDNEPLLCACDMCGQSRPVATRQRRTSTASQKTSAKAALKEENRANLEAESVRVLQEERLQELAKFHNIGTSVSNQEDEQPEHRMSDTSLRLSDVAEATTSRIAIPNKQPISANRATAAIRSRSPVPRKGKLMLLSSQGNEVSSLMDGSLNSFFDDSLSFQKTRRPKDLEDSAATATTFAMSSSTFNYFPGIEEEEDGVHASP